MFDRVGEAAEKLATNVSRRAFMGRLGRGAIGLTALIGGMFSFPGQAQARNKALCCLCQGGKCWKPTKSRPCPSFYCGIVYCYSSRSCPG
jgi:hypothetical protein